MLTARQPCEGGLMGGLGASEAEPWVKCGERSIVVATEHGDAPVGALDLKMFHDVPGFIDVRAAGDRRCSTDHCLKPQMVD
jgi:hypothetical protein